MTTDNSTAPVQGLTDEQIEQIARSHGTGGWQTLGDMIRYGKTVIRAALAEAPSMTREQAAAIAHKHEFKPYQRLLGSAAKPEAVGQAPAWIIDAIMEAAAPHTAPQ